MSNVSLYVMTVLQRQLIVTSASCCYRDSPADMCALF